MSHFHVNLSGIQVWSNCKWWLYRVTCFCKFPSTLSPAFGGDSAPVPSVSNYTEQCHDYCNNEADLGERGPFYCLTKVWWMIADWFAWCFWAFCCTVLKLPSKKSFRLIDNPPSQIRSAQCMEKCFNDITLWWLFGLTMVESEKIITDYIKHAGNSPFIVLSP